MNTTPVTTGVLFGDIFRGSQWDIIGDKFPTSGPDKLGKWHLVDSLV